MNFRSQLLKARQSPRDPKRIKSVKRRIIIAIPLLLLATIPILGVWNRSLDMVWGRRLYQFHDNWWLWIKGNLFTRFYPESIILWGVAGVLLIFALFLSLSVTSATRSWHIKLICGIIRRESLHRSFFSAFKRLRSIGFKQRLLLEVARREKELLFFFMASSPSSSAGYKDLRALHNATLFYHRLLIPLAFQTEERLKSAVNLHETLMIMRLWGESLDDGQRRLITHVATRLGDVLKPYYKWEKEESNSLGPGNLAGDLLLIAAYFSEETAKSVLPQRIAQKPLESIREYILTLLALSVDNRLNTMERLSRDFELKAFPAPREGREAPEPVFLLNEEDPLPILGRLTLNVALDFAALTGKPEIAISHMEAMDSLSLVSEIVMQGHDSEGAKKAGLISDFLGDLPGPVDYRIIADLARERIEKEFAGWRGSLLSKKSVLTKGDRDLALAYVNALYEAAGPDFNGEPGTESR